jgi:hypothetical protein
MNVSRCCWILSQGHITLGAGCIFKFFRPSRPGELVRVALPHMRAKEGHPKVDAAARIMTKYHHHVSEEANVLAMDFSGSQAEPRSRSGAK